LGTKSINLNLMLLWPRNVGHADVVAIASRLVLCTPGEGDGYRSPTAGRLFASATHSFVVFRRALLRTGVPVKVAIFGYRALKPSKLTFVSLGSVITNPVLFWLPRAKRTQQFYCIVARLFLRCVAWTPLFTHVFRVRRPSKFRCATPNRMSFSVRLFDAVRTRSLRNLPRFISSFLASPVRLLPCDFASRLRAFHPSAPAGTRWSVVGAAFLCRDNKREVPNALSHAY